MIALTTILLLAFVLDGGIGPTAEPFPAPAVAGPALWHVAGATYTLDEPSACWDQEGRHAFPTGIRDWTAHKTLPCGTLLDVELLDSEQQPTGRTVQVEVWDRGPYRCGFDLDLSLHAFDEISSPRLGTIMVRWRLAS